MLHNNQAKSSQELIPGIHGAGAKQGPWGSPPSGTMHDTGARDLQAEPQREPSVGRPLSEATNMPLSSGLDASGFSVVVVFRTFT